MVSAGVDATPVCGGSDLLGFKMRGRVAETQLTARVAAKAPQRMCSPDGTGMDSAGAHLRPVTRPTLVHLGGKFHIVDVGGLPRLATTVEAPAPESMVRADRAGVVTPRSDTRPSVVCKVYLCRYVTVGSVEGETQLIGRIAPQHHSVWSVRIPQLCSVPRLTSVQLASPPTWVGNLRLMVSPSPSWPWSLSPQHHRVWSVRTPHECEPPVLIVPQEDPVGPPALVDCAEAAVAQGVSVKLSPTATQGKRSELDRRGCMLAPNRAVTAMFCG
jgi:hypothetical protein